MGTLSQQRIKEILINQRGQEKEMINKIFKFLYVLLCFHKFDLKCTRIDGATVGWSGKPDRLYSFIYKCRRCGKNKVESGFVVFGDKEIHPEAYNERGWPIDENGKELPIAE